MALQIREEYGVLKILGNLNSQSHGMVMTHLRKLLETKERILVSLEDILSMDQFAARAFENLFREVSKQNKVLSIFGQDNKNIASILSQTNTKYIFSEDRE